ncbi:unnamed protein product [Symbiodinium sp. KB8]|nr:unnamed protein product [Symbiodinium sp. KB8]
MDSRATVGQLRERLASLAGTNTDHLLLEKVHPHSLSGISMRDDKVALDDMYFQDGTLVRLQTGERMQPGQVKAKFSLYKGPFPTGTSWVTEAASSPEEDDESVPEHLRGWRSHGGWAPKPLSPEELAAASKPPPPPRSGAPTEDVPAAEKSVDKQGGAAGAEASEGQAVTEETSEDAAGEKDGEAGSEDATGDAGAGADGKEAEDAAEEAEKEAAIAKAWAADPSPYNGLEDVSIEQFATLPLSKEESVSTVKARVVQRLIELGKAGPETTPAHLRIRQRPTLRCTRIFPDGSRIKDTVAHVWENQEFCVELLPSPEKHMTGKAKREEAEAIAAVAESEAAAAAGDAAPAPAPAPAPVTYSSITSGASCADEDDVVVVVAWFDRARYKLTTPRELRFLMGTPVKDAVEEAARLAGIAKPENVSWILNAGGKVELFHVRNLLFKKCSDASSTFSLKTKYVRDGHLLLLQDTSVPLKALSEAEMAAINPHAGYTYVPRTQSRISGTYTAPYRPREAGLKIGVRIEQDAQGASGSGEEASASAAASAAPAPTITQHQDLPGSATGTLGKSEADLVREAATRARLREEEEAKTAELGEEPIYGDFDLLGGF